MSLSNVTYFRAATRIVQGESVYKEASGGQTVAAAEPSPAHPARNGRGCQDPEEGESRSVFTLLAGRCPSAQGHSRPKVTLQGESQGNKHPDLTVFLLGEAESKRRPGSRYPVMRPQTPRWRIQRGGARRQREEVSTVYNVKKHQG